MSHRLLVTLFCTLSAACAVDQASKVVFDSPDQYRDETVELCGWLAFESEDHNLYPSRISKRRDEGGLGVTTGDIEYGELAQFNGNFVCVQGAIRYSGCTVDSFCNATNFPFEIEIDQVK